MSFASDRMGLRGEPTNLLSVAKWEPPSIRSKVDVSESSLRDSQGCCNSSRVHTPINIAEVPLDTFEPPIALAKPSGQHVGEKILKFLKLRGKSNSGAALLQEAFQPSLQTFRFQDESDSKRFASVEDVTARYHYDSDEHIDSVSTSGVNSNRRDRSSCSTSASSSSRCSSTAQSFSSNTSRSSTTPRASFILSGHQSSAQLMANILISIAHMDEDDDELGGRYDHPALDGPHESAWHQPLDEIFAASPAGARHSSAKQSSGRNTPKLGRCSIDLHLTSPGPSRRYGKLDLSRIDKLR